jgi:hypothetical protein
MRFVMKVDHYHPESESMISPAFLKVVAVKELGQRVID